MNNVHLVIPQLHHKELVLDYKHEHLDNQEQHLHGSSMLDSKNIYEEWLSCLYQNNVTVPKGWVASSTFLAMNDAEDSVIGMIDIRHEVNEKLRNYGGHIGFGVRPSQRNKGYATQILQQGLTVCKSLKINKVMLTCDKQNIGSRNIILKAGGILEKEFHHDDEMLQVYWIAL